MFKKDITSAVNQIKTVRDIRQQQCYISNKTAVIDLVGKLNTDYLASKAVHGVFKPHNKPTHCGNVKWRLSV